MTENDPWDLFIQMPAALTFPSGDPPSTTGATSRIRSRTWAAAGLPMPAARSSACWNLVPPANPPFQAFFKAAQESGFPPTDHVNGCRERGIEPLDEDLEPQRVS